MPFMPQTLMSRPPPAPTPAPAQAQAATYRPPSQVMSPPPSAPPRMLASAYTPPAPPPPQMLASAYTPPPQPPPNVDASTITPTISMDPSTVQSSSTAFSRPMPTSPPPDPTPAPAPQPDPGQPMPPPPPPPQPPQQGPFQNQNPMMMRQGYGGMVGQGYGGMMPPQYSPMQTVQGQGRSLEQQALNGGGVDNKQQISNFMTALDRTNSGGNNAFGNAGGPPAPAPVGNLVNLPAPQAPQAPPQAPPQPVWSQGPEGSSYYTPGTAKMGSQGTSMVPNLRGMMGAAPQAPPQGYQGALDGLRAMSDERAKEQVQSAKPSLEAFMSSIGAHNYQYKNPERDGVGVFTSPMAQELEKTELGKQAVVNTPHGKMVEYGRLGGINLAAVSVVHRETQKLKAQVEALRAEMRKGRN